MDLVRTQPKLYLQADRGDGVLPPSPGAIAALQRAYGMWWPEATVLFVLLKTREVGDKRLHMRGRARIRDDGPGSSARRALTLSVKGFYIGVGSA